MANRFTSWVSRTVTRIFMRDIPLSALAEYLLGTDNVTAAWRYPQFSKFGFERNPVVNACIREIMESGSAIKIRMLVDGEVPDPKKKLPPNQQALADILKKPNTSTETTMQAFVERFLQHLLVGGVAYIHAIGVGKQALGEGLEYIRTEGELELLQPDRVEPQTEKGRITGYKIIDVEGQPIIPPEDILMIRFPHPRFKYQGFSPVQAAALVIDTHNHGVIWNNSLLKNMGLISGIAVIKGVRTTSKEKREKIEADFEEHYAGAKNVGKIKVMAGEGVEYVELGHSIKDLDWIGGKQDLLRDICAVMRVPSQLINDPGSSTYSNYREAKRAFYYKTVLPIMDRKVQGLISWLVPKYDDTGLVTLDLDLSNIEVLRENENELVERLVNRKSWWTINELREADGKDEIDGGDILPMPFNLVPLSELSEMEPGDRAALISGKHNLVPLEFRGGSSPGWSETDREFRYQLRNADKFEKFTLVPLRSKKPRVIVTYGQIAGTSRWRKQGLRFTKTDWTSIDSCRNWLRDHPEVKRDQVSDIIEHRAGENDVTLDHVDPRSMYPTEELRLYKADRNDSIRIKHERKFRHEVLKQFARQRDQIIEAVKELTTVFPTIEEVVAASESRGAMFDEEMVPTWFIEWTETSRWVDAFDSLYTAVVLDVGDEVMAELVAAGFISDEIGFDITRPEIETWLTAGITERSRLINEHTAARIQRLLERGVADGVGMDEMERRIFDNFETISRGRSKAIARTETGMAVNIATDEAYKQSGVPLEEWISARAPTPLGNPVRTDHQDLDGQVVKVGDEVFKIENGPDAGATASTPMQFGIGRQDINCRCGTAPLRFMDEAF